MKKIDVHLVIPCLSLHNKEIIDCITHCVIGFNCEGQGDDFDVYLDTGEIVFNESTMNGISNAKIKNAILNFIKEKKLDEKAENLLNKNLGKLLISGKRKKIKEFIKNSDKDIYPECFQKFVHLKYILNKEFIKEFSQLIEKPFIPLVESLIMKLILFKRRRRIKRKEPKEEEPKDKNSKELQEKEPKEEEPKEKEPRDKKSKEELKQLMLDLASPEDKEIMSVFFDTQTFEYIQQCIEEQIDMRKNQLILPVFENSQSLKSKSCPIVPKK